MWLGRWGVWTAWGKDEEQQWRWGAVIGQELAANGEFGVIVPNDGCLNFVDENDEVLLAGFGRKGKAKGDIPGVRFKVVKVSGVGLSAQVSRFQFWCGCKAN